MPNLNLKSNVKLSEITTMRLGGSIRHLAEITTEDQISAAYDFAKKEQLSTLILGLGSNIIGRDEGFDGLILVNQLRGIEIIEKTTTELILKGYAGEVLDDFIAYGVDLGYSGMEAMSSIPGTLGAAPVQNVGAYGQELSQTIVSLEAYDTKLAKKVTILAEDMGLAYRRSIFNHGQDAGRYFIISVTVRLAKKQLTPPFYISLQNYIEQNNVTDFSPASIRSMVMAIRAEKLPDPKNCASAGSFFKNVYLNEEEAELARAKDIPVWQGNKVPSGWLIENAGLKGKEFFGFRVSSKAALILINETAASYADLAKARQAISDAVFAKFGYKLEQEPVEAAA